MLDIGARKEKSIPAHPVSEKISLGERREEKRRNRGEMSRKEGGGTAEEGKKR